MNSALQSVYPRLRAQTAPVSKVLEVLRFVNGQYPAAIHLEAHELRAVLRRDGCDADLVTLESTRGWLLGDMLEVA